MNRETYDEQGPIREQELPEVEVSEVRIRDEQSRTVVRGIPLVHEEPRQADRPEAGSRVAICPWDYQPVAEPGDTCDFDCYQSWWAWYYGLRNGLNDGVVRLSSDDLPPKDLEKQPWYATMVGVGDEEVSEMSEAMKAMIDAEVELGEAITNAGLVPDVGDRDKIFWALEGFIDARVSLILDKLINIPGLGVFQRG